MARAMLKDLTQLIKVFNAIFKAVYPPDLGAVLIALFMAVLLDYTYPYHRGVLLAAHPVHTCFKLARRLARPYAGRLYGALLAIGCIVTHIAPPITILALFSMIRPMFGKLLWIIVSAWILKLSISIRLLLDTGIRIGIHAERGNWSEVRRLTQGIVRRNVYSLDEEHVLSAAIESLSESLVDGIVSPLFYYPFLGILGPYLQRIVNTLDGAVGFKSPEYRRLGWFSAKLDTLVNYLPARVSALYIIFSALLLGYDWRRAREIWRRDHAKTESLNAGNPMAAIAGALGIRLEKPGFYTLGDPNNRLDPSRIFEAVRIVLVSTIIHLAMIVLILIAFHELAVG